MYVVGLMGMDTEHLQLMTTFDDDSVVDTDRLLFVLIVNLNSMFASDYCGVDYMFANVHFELQMWNKHDAVDRHCCC